MILIGPTEPSKNTFNYFDALFLLFAYAHSHWSLSKTWDFGPDNLEQVSQYTVDTMLWCIFRITHWLVHEDILCNSKVKIIWRVINIRLSWGQVLILLWLWFGFNYTTVNPFLEITYATNYWFPCLEVSRYELDWDLENFLGGFLSHWSALELPVFSLGIYVIQLVPYVQGKMIDIKDIQNKSFVLISD